MAATAALELQQKACLSTAGTTTQILSDLRERVLRAYGLSLQTLDGRSLIPHSTPEARLELFNKTSFSA